MKVSVNNHPPFTFAAGDMGKRFQTLNWTLTPLGSPEQWSAALKTSVGLLLNSSVPTLLWWGQDLTLLYNDACRPWLGTDFADALGTSGRHILPGIWPQWRACVLQTLEQNVGGRLENQSLPSFHNGTVSESKVSLFFNPILTEEGKTGGVFCTLVADAIPRTATEKNADAALRASEERYRAFVSQSSEAIWRFELEQPLDITLPFEEWLEHAYRYGYLAECNDAMAQMYGFAAANDIVGTRLGDLLPADNPTNQAYLRSFFQSGYRLTDAESYEVDRHGQSRYFLNNLIGVIENGYLVRAWGTQRDISAQKSTEKALRLANERFQIAEQVANGFSYEWNSWTQEVTRSTNFSNILGYAPAEFAASTEAWYQLCHPEDVERLAAEQRKIVAEKENEFSVQYRVRHRDGHWLQLLDQARIFRNAAGEVERTVGICVDITTQKQVEKALRRSEERMRLAMQAAEMYTWEVDLKTRIVQWSDNAAQVLGFYPEELPTIFDEVLAFVHAADLPSAGKAFQRAVNERKSYGTEFRMINPRGEVVWIRTNGLVSENANGEAVRIVGITQNITARKQLEAQFQAQLEELETIYRTAPIGLDLIDAEFRYIRINDRLALINGLSAEEHIGRTVWEVVPDIADQVVPVFRHIFATGESVLNVEVTGETQAQPGLSRTWINHFSPIKDAQGNTIAINALVEEITERKRVEQNRQFLLEITEDLAHLSRPEAMMELVGSKLGTFLNASRCTFTEYDPSLLISIVTYDWCAEGQQSIVGVYQRSSFFNAAILQQLNSGKQLVLDDTEHDPRTADRWQSYQAIQLSALVTSPYLSEGVCKASLSVNYPTAHHWRGDELQLIQEVSDRVWSRIERARAEAALQANEHQLRLITDALPVLISYVDKDHYYRFVNRTYTTWFNISKEEIIGKHTRDILGEAAYQAILPSIERVLAGEEFTFERLVNYQTAGKKHIRVNYIPNKQDGEVKGWYALVQDITERKEAEETLTREREQLAIALRTGQMGVYEWRTGEEHIWWSPEVYPVYGVDAATFSPTLETFMALIHPDDREELWRKTQASLNSHEVFFHEYRIIPPNGNVRWIANRSHIGLNADGTVARITGVAMDVTERKEAENRVKESEQRLRLAMEVGKAGSWDLDLKTGENIWSEGHFTLFGLEPTLDTTSNYERWLHCLHPDDKPRIIEAEEISREQRQLFHVEYRIHRADNGDLRWINAAGQYFYDESGQAVRFIGVFFDITERKLLEEANRAQLRELENVYNSAPIGMALIDPDFRFIRVNESLAEINGFSIEQHLGRTVRELVPHIADHLEAIYQSVFETGLAVLNEEITGETNAQPGVTRFWNESWYPLKDAFGKVTHINVIVEETTERKRIEAQVAQLNERNRSILESITDAFFSMNRDWIFTYANPKAHELLQKEPGTLIGKNMWEEFPEAVHSSFYNIYHQALYDKVSTMVEDFYPPLNTWFEVRAYPSDDGLSVYFHNINARKEAERAIRESNERYHTLFNSIDEGFCVCEMLFDEKDQPVDYRFLEVNPMYIKLTGLADPIGKTGRELEPNLEEKWFEIYGQVVKTGESIRFESHMAAWNKWYDLHVSRIGRPEERKFAILFNDITERKENEAKLRESEQQLQHLANAMPQVVWISNPIGEVYYYNQRVAELDGIVQTAPDHWEWRPMLHPTDEASTILAWQKAVQEKSTYSHEHRLRMKDGSYRWHLSRGFPVLDEAGNILRWYGTATEIEDLKRTQQEVLESKIRFQHVADTVPVLIWQAGLDKKCYYFNKGWLDFTGRTLEQEQGHGWTEGVHPDDFDRCLEIYTTAFDQREEFAMEYRLRYHDGSYRWIYDRGVPTYDHLGTFSGYMGGCIDIHERKRAEEQKDAFIRIAGHELRTPLTGLLGNLNLMQKSLHNTEATAGFLRKSYASALKMRGLINDFLYFSNTQPGQFAYKIASFDFDVLVTETVQNIRLSYPQFEIEIFGTTDKTLQGDQSRMEQVISNLLSNAIKYSPTERRAEVHVASTPDHIILQVKDYGIGIAPEEQANIFKLFYRAGNTQRIKGMGLGLYIVQQIVDYHQGTIEVTSQPGKGSTFTVTLPLAQNR